MASIYEKGISPNLKKLIEFSKEHTYFFAEFAVVSPDDDTIDAFVDSWDWSGANLDIAKRDLFALSQADGMGGYFAFWDDGKGKSLDEMPIIILGSEGELPLVAENLKGLMRLMTSGDELSTYENKAWCKADTIGEYNEDYAAWLKKEFDLEPLTTAKEGDDIIKAARREFGSAFEKWAKEALDPDFELGDDYTDEE